MAKKKRPGPKRKPGRKAKPKPQRKGASAGRKENPLGATRINPNQYRTRDGEIISKREYQKRERIERFGGVVTNERLAQALRLKERWIRDSQNDELTKVEKRELAQRAFELGFTRGKSRKQRAAMFEALRELDFAEDSDDFAFWEEDHQSP